MTNKKTILLFLLPILLSFILHFHVFNLDVLGYHVWRQSQTQTVIYHLTFTDPSPFHPQRFDFSSGTNELLYEFPLYQFVIAQFNRCVGYSVLNSRLITFLIFGFILFGFYKLLRHFVKKEIALMSHALICFSPLLYYYCVNPMPDILALCFGIWTLHFFFSFKKKSKWFNFLFFCLFLMLAALVKLPYLLFGSIYILKFFSQLKQKQFLPVLFQALVLLLSLIPVFLWYNKAIPTWKNNELTSGIFRNNKSFWELAEYFRFHLVSSVPELLTNYATCLFLFFGIYCFVKHRKQIFAAQSDFIVLSFFISAYFIFELNMIEKVHDYYLMPFVPLIFMLVAYGLKQFYNLHNMKWIYLILFVVPITAWIRIDGRWNTQNPGFNPDYLYETQSLQKIIPSNALCVIDHDDSKCISLYYLKRYGFSLFENEMSPEKLTQYYAKGARYLLSENLSLNLNAYKGFVFEERFRKNLVLYKVSRP